jgi:2'-5' RNA ligase
MRDHWWWRPGWSVGRSFYTWHLTFDGQDALHRLAGRYQPALAPLPGLDLVHRRWLHLTMQGVGFTDEVPAAVVDQLVEAAGPLLGGLPRLELAFGPVAIRPEAVAFPPSPAGHVHRVRTAIRAAIVTVGGQGGVPEPAEGYQPHVTIAYSNGEQPIEPIVRAVETVTVEPATVMVAGASLIELRRDARRYAWRTVATVPFEATQRDGSG